MALAQTRTKKVAQKDPVYREQLITEYLPYVKRIVQRLAVHLPSTVDIDDLMNVGVIGLIQAVDRYDPRRDNKFMTYAIFRIKGAVLSELRARDFLSRSNRRKIREFENVFMRLEQKLGREAEDNEVAQELGVDLEQVYRTKQMSSISFISLEELDQVKGIKGGDGSGDKTVARKGTPGYFTLLFGRIDHERNRQSSRNYRITRIANSFTGHFAFTNQTAKTKIIGRII